MQTEIHPPRKSAWPVFAGALILLLILAFAVRSLNSFSPYAPDDDAARVQERTKAREDLEAENEKRLATYAWADKAKGSVQIPIQQAMELTLVELQGKQPRPAGPVATPAPAASPATPAP